LEDHVVEQAGEDLHAGLMGGVDDERGSIAVGGAGRKAVAGAWKLLRV
jgi:hypothetical protein